MNVYIITSKENVRLRWYEVSGIPDLNSLDVENLGEENFTSDCCLLVHLDSLNPAQIDLLGLYWDKVKLIGFSDNPNDKEGIELLLKGFKGYINTFVTASIYKELIDSVRKGDIWAGTSIVQKMLGQMQLIKMAEKESEKTSDFGVYELSERELDVVNVLISGASNKEIGKALDITERTVKAHVSSILRKTETSDRVSLILKLKDIK